ncbi:MAG: DNA polymerase III subunit delta [Sedimentisphaerales bacterium]|jgi:DNA polymerase-3 subunit delta|nr:DNA polymerase III subunit delta [Sedimentisphaerales bacterium]HNY77354.1 DNA polymerase III subunit delta [Sedimentisphaerales bacterium]HOC62043.1 DNA polymerase III subunit delta [Sedimentisphaerales bacterium]HOH63570.1 DNA polymerase III subunit delta [Sedimentisphaerales bacterium]HPY48530.1 DNA polymerase III subunit delta [Sedimentisphaerales bacterium]
MGEQIYVIAGKEEPLVNARCQELIDRLVDPQDRMTGLLSADGDQLSISDVLDELRTAPFLTGRRVVVVKGADEFVSKNRSALENYFDKPSATGILVLTVGSWPKQTKLARKLAKVGTLIEVIPPKRYELPKYLAEYAQRTSKMKLDRPAAEMLIELVGEDLTLLCNEIDKLVLFARDEKAITSKHVESLAGHNRIFGAFEVIEAMIAGDPLQAIRRLRNMFEEDKSAEYTVVGAFAYHLRRMFSAKALLEKGAGPGDVAQKLRIWNNKERFFTQLRQTSLEQLGKYIEQLAAIDYAVKTGQAKTQVAMEQLVLRLAG